MRIINKGRGGGKTLQLLYTSELTGYRIICSNQQQVEYLKRQAEKLGLDIPEPMSYVSYGSVRGLHDDKILVDNVEQMLDRILSAYFKKDVCAATMSVPMEDNHMCEDDYKTPIGSIVSWVSNDIPKGYLVCNGRTYPIGSYPEFEIYLKNIFGIVNYFGGNGITDWAVPDLEGKFLIKIEE